MNKAQLKKIIKEELQSAVAEAHGGDSLGEMERIATTMHQAAGGLAELGAGDQVEQYAAGFSDLAERLREAVAAHREEMSQPGW
tara:strand:- start:62 stop:313 length:252 start_codon:yes stop_codon:yes gene_type:complete